MKDKNKTLIAAGIWLSSWIIPGVYLQYQDHQEKIIYQKTINDKNYLVVGNKNYVQNSDTTYIQFGKWKRQQKKAISKKIKSLENKLK